METTTEGQNKIVVTWLPRIEGEYIMESPTETTPDIATIYGIETCQMKTKAQMTADEIKVIISSATGVSIDQMKEKGRKGEYVEARQFSMYFIKDKTTLSLKSIGEMFNRDHTTVMHAIDTINNRRDTNKKFKEKFEYLQSLIG